MTKEESLQILNNCLKQLEAISEDEIFDFFYNNSSSFKKEIDKLKEKGEKMDKELAEWVAKAVETIKSGIADKLDKGNIKVYKIPSPNGSGIIRIDIKQ